MHKLNQKRLEEWKSKRAFEMPVNKEREKKEERSMTICSRKNGNRIVSIPNNLAPNSTVKESEQTNQQNRVIFIDKSNSNQKVVTYFTHECFCNKFWKIKKCY